MTSDGARRAVLAVAFAVWLPVVGDAAAFAQAGGQAGNASEADDRPVAQAMAIVAPKLPGVLDDAASNRAVPWADQDSGLSGDIVAYSPTMQDGVQCRALRITVQGAVTRFAVEGERCLDGDGWGPGRVPDRVYEAPAASPLIRDLQSALRRLDYYDGAVDGVASDPLTRASLAFEHDEQVAPDAEPTQGLLELTDAAIARIPPPGSCAPSEPMPEGWSAACGTMP